MWRKTVKSERECKSCVCGDECKVSVILETCKKRYQRNEMPCKRGKV